jgi:hypothetical protein
MQTTQPSLEGHQSAALGPGGATDAASAAGPAVDELPISSSGAQHAVADYVSRNGLAQRFEGFAVAVTVDAGTARVTVELAARVPLVLAGDAGGIPITAEATATAPLS